MWEIVDEGEVSEICYWVGCISEKIQGLTFHLKKIFSFSTFIKVFNSIYESFVTSNEIQLQIKTIFNRRIFQFSLPFLQFHPIFHFPEKFNYSKFLPRIIIQICSIFSHFKSSYQHSTASRALHRNLLSQNFWFLSKYWHRRKGEGAKRSFNQLTESSSSPHVSSPWTRFSPSSSLQQLIHSS